MKKIIFFAPGTLVDPPLAPTVTRLCCPPAKRTYHWYEVVGISLGDSEAWKPQKMGGCGWNTCPRNLVLSHVTQDTAPSWFWMCWAVRRFLAIFGLFLGHIVELEGKKGLLFTSQLRHMWSVGTLCLRLAVMTGFWGRFGPKKAVLGHKMRSFGRAPPDLAPPPRGATAEFLAIKLDLAWPPPRL